MPRVLVVEDDESVRELVKRNLRDFYEIIETGDATRALALALEQKPDCILLDLNLPDFSGFELCQIFSELSVTSLIPVMVITVEPAAQYKEICEKLGAVDYIEKPLNFSELKDRVEAVLRLRRTERRREPRVRLSVNLKLTVTDSKGANLEIPVVTEDVSVSGFSCSYSGRLMVASVVDVWIRTKKERHVGRARVVRIEHEGTPRQKYGFYFIEKKSGQWILQ